MSLQAQPAYSVPAETARIAQAAFPNGNLYLRFYDKFGTLFTEPQFAPLFPKRGQPAQDPVRLALATLMQFAEGMSDRQAAEAVRSRIDWKYLLCLELTNSGFDHTVLSEFRTRLLAGKAEQLLFETLVQHCQQEGWLKAGGRQRTDSTHVLAAVRELNRLERVGETFRHALNVLATVAPEWLRPCVKEHWWERYNSRVENYQLPKAETERESLAASIGEDGFYLLDQINQASGMAWLKDIEAVKTLQSMWQQQYFGPGEAEKISWRPVKELAPSSQQIASPYDAQARFARKREVEWVGYKVHLTETCEEELPHLITHVETTVASTPDEAVTLTIHQELAKKALLPSQHFVDAGYTDARIVVQSQKHYGVEIVGPLALDPSWQAKAGEGFDKANFRIDWEAKKVICPAGKTSQQWKYTNHKMKKASPIKIRFARSDCNQCEVRERCTKAKVEPREIALQPREEHEATQLARQKQQTAEFKSEYGRRAGVEGTIGQGVRRVEIRRARYFGLAKTHLQHLLSAAALNLIRIGEWLVETPLAKTRVSAFAALKIA